jgi:hypothetical protein
MQEIKVELVFDRRISLVAYAVDAGGLIRYEMDAVSVDEPGNLALGDAFFQPLRMLALVRQSEFEKIHGEEQRCSCHVGRVVVATQTR